MKRKMGGFKKPLDGIDLRVGIPGYPNGQCIAESRSRKREDNTLTYDEARCRHAAIRGYHVCRIHGANPGNHGGRPVTHGRRSKFAGGANRGDRRAYGLEPVIQEFLQDDRWMDLRREIATLRALLEVYLQKHDTDNYDEDVQKHVARIADQIGILVDRLHKILYGEEYTVNIYGIQAFAARVAEVLNKIIVSHCCDNEDCLYFGQDTLLQVYQGLDEIFGRPIDETTRLMLGPAPEEQ